MNVLNAEGYPGKRYYGGCENVDSNDPRPPMVTFGPRIGTPALATERPLYPTLASGGNGCV